MTAVTKASRRSGHSGHGGHSNSVKQPHPDNAARRNRTNFQPPRAKDRWRFAMTAVTAVTVRRPKKFNLCHMVWGSRWDGAITWLRRQRRVIRLSSEPRRLPNRARYHTVAQHQHDDSTHMPINLWQPGQSGNPAGRVRGSRNKLSEEVICALLRDFREHGQKAIAKVRRTQPAAYLKVLALLI